MDSASAHRSSDSSNVLVLLAKLLLIKISKKHIHKYMTKKRVCLLIKLAIAIPWSTKYPWQITHKTLLSKILDQGK